MVIIILQDHQCFFFNNFNIFKPLCCGHITSADPWRKIASIGKIDFTFERTATGTHVITLASALPDTNYLVQLTLYNTGAVNMAVINKTTTSFTITTRTAGGALSNCEVMFTVHYGY